MVLPNNFSEKLANARRPNEPRINLRLGDSAKVLKSIPSLSIDMVMTSPPYDFIGIEISEEYFKLASNRIRLGLKSSEKV